MIIQRVESQSKKMTVLDIVEGDLNYKNGTQGFQLCIEPPYQRKKSWTEDDTTGYMQTLIFFQDLGGHFYLEKVTTKNGVVHNVCDGHTRLRHSVDFVNNLTEIKKGRVVYNPQRKKNPDYQIAGFRGMTFVSLPPEVKEAILSAKLSITILDGDEYPGIGKYVFDLLNSCSKQINKQEQRNAKWHSDLTVAVAEFVGSCFEDPLLKDSLAMTFNRVARMTVDKYMFMGIHILEKGIRTRGRVDPHVEEVMRNFLKDDIQKLPDKKRKNLAKAWIGKLEAAIKFWSYLYAPEKPHPFSDQVWWDYPDQKKMGTRFAPTVYAILLKVFALLEEDRDLEVEVSPPRVIKYKGEIPQYLIKRTVWGIMNKHLNSAAYGRIPVPGSKKLFSNRDNKIAVEKRWCLLDKIATEIVAKIKEVSS